MTAAISPYRHVRDEIRMDIGDFLEVYAKCPLDTCIERDVKGLYKKAIAGEIPHFTGVSDPYEEPINPEVVCETDKESVEACADKILARHIGRPILLELEAGAPIAGTLLSYDAAQIVLEAEAPPHPLQIVQRHQNVRNIKFAELPGGLITKPTLVWLVDPKQEGEHLAKVTHLLQFEDL